MGRRVALARLSLPDLAGAVGDRGHGVAGVHDARRPRGEFLVVHAGMVGGNDESVEAGDGLATPGRRLVPHATAAKGEVIATRGTGCTE